MSTYRNKSKNSNRKKNVKISSKIKSEKIMMIVIIMTSKTMSIYNLSLINNNFKASQNPKNNYGTHQSLNWSSLKKLNQKRKLFKLRSNDPNPPTSWKWT
jgi:hypothetical protein